MQDVMALRANPARHWLMALHAIGARETVRYFHQSGRLVSALVRPLLWLVCFAAGFRNVLGVSIIPPYHTYIEYREYLIPGLVGIVLLFNGMLSSLSLVTDREAGMMRLVLTAPLPRWYLLFCKLAAGAFLSVLQAYAFLAVAFLLGVRLPVWAWAQMLPAIVIAGFMLGSLGLLLSVWIRQLENFAGTMNFVIFPMFFLSSALFPLWKLKESGSLWLWQLASINPFTHAVELIRFAAYGQLAGISLAVVCGSGAIAFAIAAAGYDPQSTFARRRGKP